jgi:HSP20 family protein
MEEIHMSEITNVIKKDDSHIEQSRQFRTIVPEVDIFENEEEILMCADLPGVVREKLTVQVDNGKLTLTGIRQSAPEGVATWEEFSDVEYHRMFSVPQTIDVTNIKAELNNGVLKLHLAKSAAAKPKKIEIQVV